MWVEVRGLPAKTASLLSPCGSRGLNSGHQVWQQAHLSCWPHAHLAWLINISVLRVRFIEFFSFQPADKTPSGIVNASQQRGSFLVSLRLVSLSLSQSLVSSAIGSSHVVVTKGNGNSLCCLGFWGPLHLHPTGRYPVPLSSFLAPTEAPSYTQKQKIWRS